MQERKKLQIGRPKGSKTFDPAPAQAFGEVVRLKRQEIGLSQEELAIAADVERSHMGKIERGEHIPNLVLILKIAKVLAVSPGSLVDASFTKLKTKT